MGGSAVCGAISMSAIVGLSFCCMVVGGLVGFEWSNLSSIGFSFAALAAIVFFSAIDAWECESGPASDSAETTPVPVFKRATRR
jgi:hypothetical protein